MENQNSKTNLKLDTALNIKCHYCGDTYIVRVNSSDYVRRITFNTKVQDCFPYLSVEERESIISGLCSNCQKILFFMNYTEEEVKKAEEIFNQKMGKK